MKKFLYHHKDIFSINLIYKIDSMYKIDYAPPRKNPDNSILLPIRSNTWAHTYSKEGGNIIYLSR